jgi:hypothetical protein
VWASSQFLFDMYQQATDKPVKLVPLAVSVERMKPYPRSHYGLPEGKFLFLYIFDFNSSVSRKNPMAAVQAFKQAFAPTDNSVGMVFKTMNTKPNNPEWQVFLRECQADWRIKIITETLERPEVLGLINVCDTYVSLHRTEGYGRTIAEAILLTKPVIATNYSGQADILNKQCNGLVKYQLVPVTNNYHWIDENDNAEWAEPDINDSISKFREARKSKNINDIKKLVSTPIDVAALMVLRLKNSQESEWIEQNNLFVYNHGWQTPAKTEKWVWERLEQEKIIFNKINIICFPWATLIDLIERGKSLRANELLAKLSQLVKGDGRRVTFCQHVKALKYSYLFKLVEVDVLYWSHKRIGGDIFDGIEIKPLPLYPVINADESSVARINPPLYEYSFIGAYDAGCYLTDIRNRIFSYIHPKSACVIRREKWHYEDVVYGEQIECIPLTTEVVKRMNDESLIYSETMLRSVFCLCPSGSGPNSIRFWEALSIGAVPILLSDDLDLPPMSPSFDYMRWAESEFESRMPTILNTKKVKCNEIVHSGRFLDYLVNDLRLIA